MIYIYCPRASDGARALVEWLRGNGVSARKVSRPQVCGPSDKIVCWGQGLGYSALNSAVRPGKFHQLEGLSAAGVPVPPHVRECPMSVGWGGCEHRCEHHQALPATPGVPLSGWVPRRDNHQGGSDLLNPQRGGDHWVKRLSIALEFRVHSFLGKSLRVGEKVLRDGHRGASSWVRSYNGGWRLSYGGAGWSACSNKQGVRDLAHRAVAALGLDFGAVDVGVQDDGTLVVFEVNTAPGLEDGTTEKYGVAIRQWGTA